jgi:hypothetical protein
MNNPISNLYNQIFRFVKTEKIKVWRFPEDRFVVWGQEDESYCRMAGYGHEVEAERTFTFENCYLENVDSDGQMIIRCVPKSEEPVQ